MYYCTIPQTIPNSNPIVPLLIVLMWWYRGIENTIIHKRAWSFVHGLLTKHSTMYATTRSIFLISLIENRRGRNCCKQHHLVPLVVCTVGEKWANYLSKERALKSTLISFVTTSAQPFRKNYFKKCWFYTFGIGNLRYFPEFAIFTSY